MHVPVLFLPTDILTYQHVQYLKTCYLFISFILVVNSFIYHSQDRENAPHELFTSGTVHLAYVQPTSLFGLRDVLEILC